MKVKAITLLAASVSVFLLSVPATAMGNDKKGSNEVIGTWSNEDPFPELKQGDSLIEHKAWDVDLHGNKTEVKPLEKIPSPSKTEIGPEMFSDSDYNYYYSHYEPWANAFNQFQFFVGSVTYENRSSNPQSMTYQQQTSVTSTWTTNGKVSFETQFGNDLIANAKYSAGFDVGRSTTTNAGYTYTGAANVSPWSKGTLALYDAGESSSGLGVWMKYTKTSGTLVGAYQEAGGAWTVATNNKGFKYTESAIAH